MLDKPEGCKECPFFDDGKGFVPDEIHPDAKIALLAQNPGDTEEAVGRPLIGRTGMMVQNDLGKFGLKREDVSYLNVIKCRYRVPGAKKKTNELPQDGSTDQAAKHCAQYLGESLRKIKPNVTALLGNLGLYYGAGEREVTSWRGSVFIAEKGMCQGRKVLPMIHPAALYSDLSWRTAYKLDFARLAKEAKSPGVTRVYNDNFRVGVTASEFIAALESLKDRYVALDVETSHAKPIEAKLFMIGIAWSAEDAMNYFTGVDYEDDCRVYEAISKFKGYYITATPFDYIVLRAYGCNFDWNRCHDLTLLHSRFDIELPHTLEFIASMLTNRPFWKWMGAVDPGKYNALDCVGEWEAFDTLSKYCQQRERGVWEIYEKDRQLLPVEVDLHLNGFPCDRNLMKEERDWYDSRREKLQATLMEAFSPKESPAHPGNCPIHKRYTGKTPLRLRKGESTFCPQCVAIAEFVKAAKPVNLRSRKSLMGILKKEGMRMLKDRETGKESLAKGKVADLYKKYGDPRLRQLLEFWEMDTVISRYFKEAWITKKTGRIHPTYSMHSAMHRWHCTRPNMQQQRKPEKEVLSD